MVKVNGESLQADGLSISALLEQLGYGQQRVAVELNEQIVPRAEYDSTSISDGDTVEVVRFVGGG